MRHGAATLLCLGAALISASTVAAHPVVVDGNPAEWTLALPATDNLGHIARNGLGDGEYAWRDAAGDERTDFAAPDTDADILQVRITGSSDTLYILVELAGVTVPAGDGAPQIQIALDLDGLPGSGQSWLGSLCDTQVNPAAAWEYLLVTRFGSGQGPAVYDAGWNEVGLGAPQAALAGNFIEIALPVAVLGNPSPVPVHFTVVSLRTDATDTAWDINGVSDVLDAVTNYGDPGLAANTWAEVGDGVVDYHFEVWFHLSPNTDPSPPVVVNEVFYDGVAEPGDEWIELYNRSGIDGLDITGYKLGDEETVDGGEGMYLFPAGSLIALDDVVVVANDNSVFSSFWSFAADFELNDSGPVTDLLPYPAWASGSIQLANSGDEVLLLDKYDTVIDVVTYGGGTWAGVTPAPNVPEGSSLERPQPQPDSNDCSYDLVERTSPTPGTVTAPQALGSPCSGAVECLSGFCSGGVCCESACDGTCDAACDAAGTCQPVVCPAPANACQLASCDPLTGCFAAAGSDCSDGDACTSGDSCDGSGNCVPGAAVTCPAPANSCQLASCDPVTGCFAAAGTACDDGDACTLGDSCDGAGDCVGTTMDCDDGNVCTDDNCDPASGCTYSNNNAPCSDGDPCTQGDVCSGGSCAGTPYSCDDFNPCTNDACNGDGTCSYTNNAELCDDGDPCTYSDVCSGGVCSGTSYSCSDGNSCTVDICNGDGTCSFPPESDGTSCTDGNPCTHSDVCVTGVCSGTLYSCNDSNICTDDVCDGGGGCFYMNNNNPCDDGNACTTGDYCAGGSCQAGSQVDCDDNNVCTDDSCNPASGCVHTNNNAACDDGDACTTGDYCAGGSCQAGSQVDCDDNNVCTDDSCNSASGCVHTNNNAACDDGDACTMNDTCAQGSCSGQPLDADGDGYVAAACGGDDCADDNPAINPGQFEGPFGAAVCADNLDNDCDGDTDSQDNGCQQCTSAADCDDGDACNGLESCSGGLCQAGTPLSCNDGNECTDDSCNPDSGCVHTNNNALCDDGNACTTADVCQNGICTGTPLNCNDFNPCTDDSCDPASGCVYTENSAPCSDGDACTLGDTCVGGSCQGTPVDCSALDDQCNIGICDPASGQCRLQPRPDGTACDDGNVCTERDGCFQGTCSGAALSCDDGDPCTDDSCDSQLGCQYVYNTAPCDDGNPCTEADSCLAGICQGQPRDCSGLDGNCLVGACDPSSGECQATAAADGTACDDGDPCTEQDACQGGVCGGQAVDCSGLDDQCNLGTCDSTSGQCQASPLPDGTVCDDGNECTAGDSCRGGVCQGGIVVPDCPGGGAGGCSCSQPGGTGGPLAGLLLLGWLLVGRRRRL